MIDSSNDGLNCSVVPYENLYRTWHTRQARRYRGINLGVRAGEILIPKEGDLIQNGAKAAPCSASHAPRMPLRPLGAKYTFPGSHALLILIWGYVTAGETNSFLRTIQGLPFEMRNR
jgi:hypothetical protein